MALEKLTMKKPKKKAAKKKVKSGPKRTAKGNIKESVREKTATLPGERFPIFDEKSAKSALKLRGRGTTESERKKIINKAGRYAPEAASKARAADKKKLRV